MKSPCAAMTTTPMRRIQTFQRVAAARVGSFRNTASTASWPSAASAAAASPRANAAHAVRTAPETSASRRWALGRPAAAKSLQVATVGCFRDGP